jgi:hypothetical protein
MGHPSGDRPAFLLPCPFSQDMWLQVQRLAYEMRQAHLPEEFVETILTGWWMTCLEILPSKERARGRF